MAQWIKEWGKAAHSEDLNSIPRVHLLDERTNFWKLSSAFPREWHTCAKNTHTPNKSFKTNSVAEMSDLRFRI